MTREEVIAMAREAGFTVGPSRDGPDDVWGVASTLERFAKLVRDDYSYTHASLWLTRIDEAVKAERAACVKVCDEIVARYRHADDAPEMVAANWCADGVRARGSV